MIIMLNEILYIKKKVFYFILLFFISSNGLALTEHAKLWLGINAFQTLSADKQWLSFVFSQLRFINQSHPWQVALLEGGIGHRIRMQDSLWVGYRWSANNPNNNFYQENRLFQQYIWQVKIQQLTSRTRIEEIQRSNQSQFAMRLRQRLALESKSYLFQKASVFTYDEVFLQIKDTNYTSNKFINENRLFIGFNLYSSKKRWWEIGYINQFQMRTSQNDQNQMSHIVSINYNYA